MNVSFYQKFLSLTLYHNKSRHKDDDLFVYTYEKIKDRSMDTVKLKDIADELGMQSKELINRVQLLYKDIKSSKSKVSEETAQEIFDTIIMSKDTTVQIEPIIYHLKNINIHFSPDKIDTTLLTKIAATYKNSTQKEFLIRSFNFSELSIVKILVAGLINLDLQKYVALQSTNKELSTLLGNMNKVLDDVDFGNIDNKHPFEEFQQKMESYKPEIVYIEGVSLGEFTQHKEVFKYICKQAKLGIKFNIGFINIKGQQQVDNIVDTIKGIS